MTGENPPPIVVRKVRRRDPAHRGGSWKVAYADFVTAMMALFIVLWILNQSDAVRQSVSLHFSEPYLSPDEISLRLGLDNQPARSRSRDLPAPPPERDASKERLALLARELQSALEGLQWMEGLEGQIIIELTEEGLRIELLDSREFPFFDVGSAVPRPQTRAALAAIAGKLAEVSNPVVLEGHTDSRPFRSAGSYGNWELSADRANAARRILTSSGLPACQIREVRGLADGRLRNREDPLDDANRRISILVRYR